MLDTRMVAGALLAMSSSEVIKERCAAWVEAHINHEALAENTKDTITYLRGLGDADDEYCMAWCFTMVSGQHGRYMPALLVNELVWHEDRETVLHIYDTEADFREEVESQAGILDNVLDVLAAVLNQHKPGALRGTYYAGYHEADGSLGIMYTEPLEH